MAFVHSISRPAVTICAALLFIGIPLRSALAREAESAEPESLRLSLRLRTSPNGPSQSSVVTIHEGVWGSLTLGEHEIDFSPQLVVDASAGHGEERARERDGDQGRLVAVSMRVYEIDENGRKTLLSSPRVLARENENAVIRKESRSPTRRFVELQVKASSL